MFDKHYSVLLLTLIRLKKKIDEYILLHMHRTLTFTLTVTEIDLQMTNIQIGIEDSIRNYGIVLFGGSSSPHPTGRYGVIGIKRLRRFCGLTQHFQSRNLALIIAHSFDTYNHPWLFIFPDLSLDNSNLLTQ